MGTFVKSIGPTFIDCIFFLMASMAAAGCLPQGNVQNKYPADTHPVRQVQWTAVQCWPPHPELQRNSVLMRAAARAGTARSSDTGAHLLNLPRHMEGWVVQWCVVLGQIVLVVDIKTEAR